MRGNSIGRMWLALCHVGQPLNLLDPLLHLRTHIGFSEGGSAQGCSKVSSTLGGDLNPCVLESLWLQ